MKTAKDVLTERQKRLILNSNKKYCVIRKFQVVTLFTIQWEYRVSLTNDIRKACAYVGKMYETKILKEELRSC